MTAARYRNYRRALAHVDMLEQVSPDSWASPGPGVSPGAEATRLLRESAEDLLLSRRLESQGEDPLETAAIVLTQLLVQGATSRALADAIMQSLFETGPARPSMRQSDVPLMAA